MDTIVIELVGYTYLHLTCRSNHRLGETCPNLCEGITSTNPMKNSDRDTLLFQNVNSLE